MPRSVLGLEIGGANLKAANATGFAVQRPFALWRYPERLADELRALLSTAPPFERLAVTMTGELCDCYETKRQGVNEILDAVEAAAGETEILVWRTDGSFCAVAGARAQPLQVAAANWLATATFAGRLAPTGAALLIDIGSTTTDIIPLWQGRTCPEGRTDPERLRSRELVYTGARRTPLCALLGEEGAAELFATTLDVYLMLGQVPEDAADRDTADGRPATRAGAHARLARMLGGDPEITPIAATHALAEKVALCQTSLMRRAVEHISTRLPAPVQSVVTAGSGEFLAIDLLGKNVCIISLAAMLGAPTSHAAAAHAVAILAAESGA